jgi:hypothetical protein
MPYYLVTQTSLVEGEDEVKAAEKVLARLRSDIAVEFTVKFDEENVRQVTVANAVALEATPPIADNPRPLPEETPEDVFKEMAVANHLDGVSKRQGARLWNIILGLCLLAAGLLIGLAI